MADTRVVIDTSPTNVVLKTSVSKITIGAEQGPPGIIALTTNGNNGAATLTNSMLNIPTPTLVGLGGINYSSLSADVPLAYNSTTGTFSIQQASNAQSGYLSNSDWATFNSKQNALGYTPEDTSNKSNSISDSVSSVKFPSWNAVSSYIPVALTQAIAIPNLSVNYNYQSLFTINYSGSVGQFPTNSSIDPNTPIASMTVQIETGMSWAIKTSGTIQGISVNAGDIIVALVNNPGQTSSNWFIVKTGNLLIINGKVNVKRFGAVGDGVTNNTNAINFAFLYGQASCNTLVFDAGIYITNGGHNWVSNTHSVEFNGATLDCSSMVNDSAIWVYTRYPSDTYSYYENQNGYDALGNTTGNIIQASNIKAYNRYKILTSGTDYVTLFGASSNAIGTIFTANANGGSSSGTGTVSFLTPNTLTRPNAGDTYMRGLNMHANWANGQNGITFGKTYTRNGVVKTNWYGGSFTSLQQYYLTSFDKAITWMQHSWCTHMVDGFIKNCNWCIYFPYGLADSGERISFTNTTVSNGINGIYVSGGAIYFDKLSSDYLTKCHLQADANGHIFVDEFHLESNIDADFWLKCSGYAASININRAFFVYTNNTGVIYNKYRYPIGQCDATLDTGGVHPSYGNQGGININVLNTVGFKTSQVNVSATSLSYSVHGGIIATILSVGTTNWTNVGFSASTWQANTEYSAGQLVQPTVANGFYYQAIGHRVWVNDSTVSTGFLVTMPTYDFKFFGVYQATTGGVTSGYTTGQTLQWPNIVGGTLTDNTVTWTCVALKSSGKSGVSEPSWLTVINMPWSINASTGIGTGLVTDGSVFWLCVPNTPQVGSQFIVSSSAFTPDGNGTVILPPTYNFPWLILGSGNMGTLTCKQPDFNPLTHSGCNILSDGILSATTVIGNNPDLLQLVGNSTLATTPNFYYTGKSLALSGGETLGRYYECKPGDIPVFSLLARYDIAEINATAINTTSGNFYRISFVGTTDFTLIGAPNNNLGTSFSPTGVGTGTGKVIPVIPNEYFYITIDYYNQNYQAITHSTSGVPDYGTNLIKIPLSALFALKNSVIFGLNQQNLFNRFSNTPLNAAPPGTLYCLVKIVRAATYEGTYIGNGVGTLYLTDLNFQIIGKGGMPLDAFKTRDTRTANSGSIPVPNGCTLEYIRVYNNSPTTAVTLNWGSDAGKSDLATITVPENSNGAKGDILISDFQILLQFYTPVYGYRTSAYYISSPSWPTNGVTITYQWRRVY